MTQDNIIHTALPCPLTGSYSARIVAEKDRSGDPLRTVMCADSGLVYVDPRPTGEETRTFYAHDYRQEYKGTYIPKGKHIVRAGKIAVLRLNKLRKHIPAGGKLLDIGSGGGEFVYLAGKAGFDARGVEPNKGYAEFSQRVYNVSVLNGFAQDIDVLPNTYDAITLFHVLEHLHEPMETLTQLANKLVPGGCLMVEVPNLLYTRTAPRQKWHVGHLFHFNVQTLQAIGVLAGFIPETVEINKEGGNVTAFFRKPTEPHASSENISKYLQGNAEKTWKALSAHTTVRHFIKLHIPLIRAVTKLFQNIGEYMFLWRHSSPKAILDSIAKRLT